MNNNNQEKPMVSVVMSVYNTYDKWLQNSIDSILDQTFKNFEFIIVLDKPSNGCEKIVYNSAKKDSRIVIIKNETNMGLTASLNKALIQAKGKYIARMDSDDISLPNRLMEQVSYMECNSSVVAIGSKAYTFGNSNYVQGRYYPNQKQFKVKMLFWNVGLIHSSALIRKDVLDKNKIIYDLKMKKSQDYKLWTELMWHGDILTLNKVHLLYRTSKAQISYNSASTQLSFANEISIEQVKKLLNDVNEDDKHFHLSLRVNDYVYKNNVLGLSNYIRKLLAANKKNKIYDQYELKRELNVIWCQKALYRAKVKKFDMLFNKRTISIFSPAVISEFICKIVSKCINHNLYIRYNDTIKTIYKN